MWSSEETTIPGNSQVDQGEALDPAVNVARQLRAGTADLHAKVETASDLPGSVQTLRDYEELLSSFYVAHTVIEGALGAVELAAGWLELGIDIAGHSQLDPLTEDLTTLGARPERMAVPHVVASGQAEALGFLYVMEGSALGRRVLAPRLKQTLGDVPSAFFDGRGRPQAWRTVQRALQLSVDDELGQRTMLSGARRAFEIFLDVFARRAARRAMRCG